MYSSDAIVLAVTKALRATPASHLGQIARCLGVGRHTIARTMKSRGFSFRELRAEVIADSARSLLTSAPPRSHKEVACLLGFTSQSAFSHFMKRHPAVECNRQGILLAVAKTIRLEGALQPAPELASVQGSLPQLAGDRKTMSRNGSKRCN
jgi:AraC-like DNA-binding protein